MTVSQLTAIDLEQMLRNWAREEYEPDAEVRNVGPMPGHAGLSFGFDVSASAGEQPQSLVIRLAPPGVRRSGNTDVLAQVPILAGLGDRGLPVAPLRWSGGEDSFFDTDAFIVDRLPGRPLHMTEADGSAEVGPEGVGSFFDQAVDVLAAIHDVPWGELAMRVARPRTLDDEIAFWAHLLGKADHTGSLVALQLETGLRRSQPAAPDLGLFHGDFQLNNLLFADGRLTGVLDWELAGVGAQLLDLGWLSMMTDPECWEDDYLRLLRTVSDRQALRARYELRSGRSTADFDWFTALACFRFGSIVAFNTMLHRSGKRPDPLYDVLSGSLDRLFERGLGLIP